MIYSVDVVPIYAVEPSHCVQHAGFEPKIHPRVDMKGLCSFHVCLNEYVIYWDSSS